MVAASFIAGGANDAVSKPRSKPLIANAAEDASLAFARPPVRFFTISGVLAKHDRHSLGAVRLASADPSPSESPIANDGRPAAALPATSNEPFGLFTFRAPEGLLWTKWRAVAGTMRDEAALIDRCKSEEECGSMAARKFVAVTQAAASGDIRARVEAVNIRVNQAIRYVSDYEQHGVADRWSSPLDSLAAGKGDCEDYAIAKYGILRAAGIAEADLKILLVRDLAVRQDHAVLAARVEGRWLILDNRRAGLMETRDLPYFMPLFAINEVGVSLFATPYAALTHHESETDLLPAADAETFAGGGQTLQLLL